MLEPPHDGGGSEREWQAEMHDQVGNDELEGHARGNSLADHVDDEVQPIAGPFDGAEVIVGPLLAVPAPAPMVVYFHVPEREDLVVLRVVLQVLDVRDDLRVRRFSRAPSKSAPQCGQCRARRASRSGFFPGGTAPRDCRQACPLARFRRLIPRVRQLTCLARQ